jgi:hypothetical protein
MTVLKVNQRRDQWAATTSVGRVMAGSSSAHEESAGQPEISMKAGAGSRAARGVVTPSPLRPEASAVAAPARGVVTPSPLRPGELRCRCD